MSDDWWRPISIAPRDGTRILAHRFSDIGGWEQAVIVRWEAKEDGFKGWWDDNGEYHGNPNRWKPLAVAAMH